MKIHMTVLLYHSVLEEGREQLLGVLRISCLILNAYHMYSSLAAQEFWGVLLVFDSHLSMGTPGRQTHAQQCLGFGAQQCVGFG